MNWSDEKVSSVVVVQKDPFSVVHSRSFESTGAAFEYSKKIESEYSLDEYNIVLTLEGNFDIIKYLSIISKEDSRAN
jgi:hypothetical protein